VKRLLVVVAIESADGVVPRTTIGFESASGPVAVSVVVAVEPTVVLPDVRVKYVSPETVMSEVVAISYGDCPAPAASLPSQRSALPVIEVQKAAQVVAVTPLKVSPPVTARFVVVAFVDVALVNTPDDGVVAPIGVLSIVPPAMVRLLATCASDAVPVRSAKLIPKVEVATWTMVFAAPPMNVPNCVIDERPVPPLFGWSVPVVSESAMPRVEVADGA
jgi:hypothetical protein